MDNYWIKLTNGSAEIVWNPVVMQAQVGLIQVCAVAGGRGAEFMAKTKSIMQRK